ncbi:TOPRIM nucleotidyl transferase/hydrolase domain-containing protein [Micromonospora sp. RTP1Z1]|uniref:TOPRIM nucleotidyl transferase/hydrolase domain-containing protein n=1 Tax=Micromonospora sp. RTP1Z1 TaxID=2994043 RepID=UPI0029C776CB|nr:TOPRIM nucleotidyl transferase/hydrolase domain-containing protein [Micromonospora sp. RTP1Z1]
MHTLHRAAGLRARTVVLVEGASDRRALEAVARWGGRSLHGAAIVPMGGITNIGYFLDLLGPRGLGRNLAGLYDAAEEGYVRRGLERAGLGAALSREQLAAVGFQVCVADLEDELIRALGMAAVEQVVEAAGDLRSLRLFQRQPAQQDRPLAAQLHRFIGTRSGRKARYADLLADALPPTRVPPALDRLLARL